MTVKQKQCLLYYLGYYVGNVDGVWGQLSKTATKAFQKDYGLTPDGIFGAATEKKILAVIASSEAPKTQPTTTPVVDDWDDIKYFSRKEFACKCGKCGGFPVEPDLNMVRVADAIRERLGVPVGVNSGVRCRNHNSAVGGASSSQHLYGTAADLGKPSGVSVATMVAIAEELMPNTGGIGIYSWGIHIDSRKTKSRWNG